MCHLTSEDLLSDGVSGAPLMIAVLLISDQGTPLLSVSLTDLVQ